MAEKIQEPYNFILNKNQKIQWLVNSLIPLNALIDCLGKANTGKSFLVESLIASVIHDKPFLGYKVNGGNVLLIDQDTPNMVLIHRLDKFNNFYVDEPKYNLYLESMKNYSLSDNSLIRIINEYFNIKLVVIDSLHSVCGGLDTNNQGDMINISKLKMFCLRNDMTIMFTHHVSEHLECGINEMMTITDINKFTMGSSVINQQSDIIMLLASSNEKKLSKIYVRMIGKRFLINKPPFIAVLNENKKNLSFIRKRYNLKGSGILSTEIEKEVLSAIKKLNSRGKLISVRDLYEETGHFFNKSALQLSFKNLEKMKKIDISRSKNNFYRVKINKK